MADNRGINDMSNQGNCGETYDGYFKRAVDASEAGDLVLAMHLYLAAYERAVVDPDIPDGMAIAGLREAWNLACDLKERSMAEYAFEKLEPFLTGDEIALCAAKLQNLALDRLEEYGFSREELQDMAEMISQDLLDGEGSVVKLESISIPHVAAAQGGNVDGDGADAEDVVENDGEGIGSLDSYGSSQEALCAASAEEPEEAVPHGKPNKVDVGVASVDFNPYDEYDTSSVGKSYHAATNDGSGSYIFTRDADRAAESALAHERADAAKQESSENVSQAESADKATEVSEAKPSGATGVSGAQETAGDAESESAAQAVDATRGRQAVVPAPGVPLKADSKTSSDMPAMPKVDPVGAPALSYRTLAGYDGAISVMRELGVGLQRDGGFRNFIDMMNARHGLDRMPALDTLLFRSPVIEDATRFVDATIGEIGLPILRMSMEESYQGAPMLCVTTLGNSRPRMNHAHNRFDGPGILVIDNLDTWSMPQIPESAEGIAGFMMANMSRGAREAVNLIHSAVEDPDVYVLATATTQGEVDPFFYDLLEPISIIDIALPTDSERSAIWAEIMHDHPSMRSLDLAAVTRFSAGLPRYDIYMAARAALEESYKTGLVQRMYLPVTQQNMFDKLAACQPLDSDEYRAIEDEVVRTFRDELENLEDLLDEPLDSLD